MSVLPDPLTPADCNLQDFTFMPIDVRRLLASETWVLASGDERAAAMCLWLESWHQIPAASLPDNPRMLAHLAQSAKWPKVQEQALRGWINCSDGRLYHPVVAEKALEAWIEKLLNSISGASGNAKRWGIEIDVANAQKQFQAAIVLLRNLAPQSKTLKKKAVLTIAAASPPDSPPDRKGQRQGQGQGSSSEANASGGKPPKTPAEEEASRLWANLKTALVEQRTSKDVKAAGVLLGGLATKYGKDLFLDACRETAAEQRVDTHTFLVSACERLAGKRVSPNRQVALEDTNLAAAAAFAGE